MADSYISGVNEQLSDDIEVILSTIINVKKNQFKTNSIH